MNNKLPSLCLAFFSILVFTTIALAAQPPAATSSSSQGSSLSPIFSLLLGSTDDKQPPSSTYPLKHGRWGLPEDILVLPAKADGQGYYYPDIQAAFPNMDWQSLERLYIPAGSYNFINMGNFSLN